jgi:ABC-type arginine transport system permease subunit
MTSCAKEDVVPELPAPPDPESPENPTDPTLTASDAINALALAYAEFESSKTLPDTIMINGTKYGKSQYLEMAARIIQNTGIEKIEIHNYQYPDNPGNDSFTMKDGSEVTEIPLDLVQNQVARQLTYADANGVFGNYGGYPHATYHESVDTYAGFFSFDRLAVVLVRVIAYFKANNSLPTEVSAFYKDEIPVNPSIITASDAIDALALAYAEFESSKTLPDTITINSIKYGKSQYVEMAARIIQNTGAAEIEIHNYNAPTDFDNEKWDTFTLKDGSEATEIPLGLVENLLPRQLNYASTSGMFANYAGFPHASYNSSDDTYKGNFCYNRLAVVLVRVIAYFKANNSLPPEVSAFYKDEIPVNPSIIAASDAINALTQAYTEFESSSTLPDTITINSIKYGKSQYVEMAARIIQNTGAAEIEIHNYNAPADFDNEKWDTFTLKDGSEATEIPLALVQNNFTRQMNYASTSGGFANFAGYPNASYNSGDDTYKGNFCYNRLAVVLARTISYYKTHSTMPTTIAATYQ